MMRRFLLFGGDLYYPAGGVNDFIGDYNTIIDARMDANAKQLSFDHSWYQIVDYKTMKEVESA